MSDSSSSSSSPEAWSTPIGSPVLGDTPVLAASHTAATVGNVPAVTQAELLPFVLGPIPFSFEDM
ncbi:unnamed protein product [Parascedosporium putredinis]|uniref:Uncharacterized protein n=1 Tax=Parascedosporium putredinis TaxID=1442378 RepID=A0A9P1H0C6_9PEZI|nr:unnamed protein product [Parascedosporium putredinis]CAI7992635.1 unnamed protein product [Parascedosporium putredinis]